MSRHITRSLIAGLAVLTATTAVVAADEIDRRQAQQERSIQQGVRSGQITRGEYVRLEQEQARIREMERRAKADGRVDAREAAAIRQAQDSAQRHIWQESHDAERRHSHGWRRWW